ncbi:hypothetical protein CR513_08039, partial [Mucuna pruriens]
MPTHRYLNKIGLSHCRFQPGPFRQKLLKMFWKVEINIPFLDAIKQIPKYAKFIKELCVHKRKKSKGGMESGSIVSVLRPRNFFCPMHHWRLYLCRCHVGLESFN